MLIKALLKRFLLFITGAKILNNKTLVEISKLRHIYLISSLTQFSNTNCCRILQMIRFGVPYISTYFLAFLGLMALIFVCTGILHSPLWIS